MFMAMRKRWVSLSVGVWLVACASVLGLLWSYAHAAGPQGGLADGWTPPAELDRPDDRPMLLLFAHPRCPCTRATMSALERLQREVPGAFAARVVFYEPTDADASWRRTDLWERAGRLADCGVVADPGGLISAGAGAAISGSVALFDEGGTLLFWGGITPSRGHEGESVGLTTVRSILRGNEPGPRRATVYGCEILGPSDHVLGCCDGGGCDASGNL